MRFTLPDSKYSIESSDQPRSCAAFKTRSQDCKLERLLDMYATRTAARVRLPVLSGEDGRPGAAIRHAAATKLEIFVTVLARMVAGKYTAPLTNPQVIDIVSYLSS
jgi:hypothetical protein